MYQAFKIFVAFEVLFCGVGGLMGMGSMGYRFSWEPLIITHLAGWSALAVTGIFVWAFS